MRRNIHDKWHFNKKCHFCKKIYIADGRQKKFCSAPCRNNDKQHRYGRGIAYKGSGIAPILAGSGAEMIIAGKLMLKGWVVYRLCSHTGASDLVAFRRNRVRFIEVRLGHRTKKGVVYFNKTINTGVPAPTEIAVYLPDNGQVIYHKL